MWRDRRRFAGAIIGPELLTRILAAVSHDADDRPVLRDANFAGATFRAGCSFQNVAFEGGVNLSHTCWDGSLDLRGATAAVQAVKWGSIIQATWSPMLAARARGLGTCWTTVHLNAEEDVADVLGIPFGTVQQVALIPVAYTKGTDFRPGARKPFDRFVHWNGW